MNPKIIRLIITTKCNLSCPYCYRENQNIGNKIIDPEHIVKNITILKDKYRTIESLLLTGGEPTLYPYLEKFL